MQVPRQSRKSVKLDRKFESINMRITAAATPSRIKSSIVTVFRIQALRMSGNSTLHVNFPNIFNHRQRLFALNTRVILDGTDHLNI